MSFLLWQRQGDMRIASTHRVLRAAEVPLLAEAQALRDRVLELQRTHDARVQAACDAAREQGFAQGLAEGRAAARDDIASQINALAARAAHQHEALREQTAALALQVARKLIGSFATPEQLVALACTAARDVMPAQGLTLVVHPDATDAVRARLAALALSPDAAPDVPTFDVRADDGCEPDTCRIETELGTIDASLDAQLARLANAWSVPSASAGASNAEAAAQ
jgi:flagellar biosynthesis/type III secretory pathway protein FliH